MQWEQFTYSHLFWHPHSILPKTTAQKNCSGWFIFFGTFTLSLTLCQAIKLHSIKSGWNTFLCSLNTHMFKLARILMMCLTFSRFCWPFLWQPTPKDASELVNNWNRKTKCEEEVSTQQGWTEVQQLVKLMEHLCFPAKIGDLNESYAFLMVSGSTMHGSFQILSHWFSHI